jgi:outer membrane protein
MAAATLLGAAEAKAETLAEAISLAYDTNPTLQAARAQLRALDESYVQARSGLGLQAQLGFTGEYDKTQQTFQGGFQQESETNSGQFSVTVTQPITTGGRVTAQSKAAMKGIESGRQQLRAVEASVLFDVVQSYLDVLRDQQALEIRRKTLDTFTRQLTETLAREKAGEVSRTDVAQAQAQLQGERALLSQAQTQLQISRAAYTAAVGRNPGTLEPPPALPGLPPSVEEAFALAGSANPQLLRAVYAEQQSQANIAAARARYRPNVSVSASYGYTGSVDPFISHNYDRGIVGRVTVTQPLYTSGLTASLVRQSLEQNTSDRISIETTRRQVVQTVSNAWNQMLTARDNVAIYQAQVEAASTAFTGMQIEYRAGLRSTYEVLNAEETLRDAELSLANAQHDDYVTRSALLNVTGRLEAGQLLQNQPLYDPKRNLERRGWKAGLPTAPLIGLVDGFLKPGAGQKPIAQPGAPANPPVLAPPAADLPADAQRSTGLPTDPVPGTTSDGVSRVRPATH